jgi:hypothetical protein
MMEEVAVSNVNVEVFIDSLGAAGAATGADAGFAGAGVANVVTTAVVVCRSPVSATLCCVCLRHRNKTKREGDCCRCIENGPYDRMRIEKTGSKRLSAQ